MRSNRGPSQEAARAGNGQSAVNLAAVKAYGDTLDDGAVQMSFCLPVKNGWHAEQISTRMFSRVDLVSKVLPHWQTTLVVL